jgi:hypothetical protein
MRRITGREKELFDLQRQIEEAAGVLLFIGGKCDWEKYKQSQKALAVVNPEYKAVLDELAVINSEQYERKQAQHKRACDLRGDLYSIIHNGSLNDEQKIALRVAVELMWSCKDGVVVRAEKRAKKEAAKNVPDFKPAAWHKKGPGKVAKSQKPAAPIQESRA